MKRTIAAMTLLASAAAFTAPAVAKPATSVSLRYATLVSQD